MQKQMCYQNLGLQVKSLYQSLLSIEFRHDLKNKNNSYRYIYNKQKINQEHINDPILYLFFSIHYYVRTPFILLSLVEFRVASSSNYNRSHNALLFCQLQISRG